MIDALTFGGSVAAVYLFVIAALLVRSGLQSLLTQHGLEKAVATDVSYLVVPVVLATLLWPMLLKNGDFLRQLFDRRRVTARLIVYALLVGVLLRAAFWAKLSAGVSLGFYSDPEISGPLRPDFGFACPSLPALTLGLTVIAVLTPIVEEFVHRGLIQTALHARGAFVAILLSSLLFTSVHRFASWDFALAAGVVLGVMFWKTHSLWPPIVTHATINALTVLDWRCLTGRWNPPVEHLPIWSIAAVSLATLAACIAAIVHVLRKKIPGSTRLPGYKQVTERLRPSR